jgi:hypothetical protein
VGTVVVNLPFGYWRDGLRKLSPAWFVAVHAPVPAVIVLRRVGEVGLSWTTLPVLVGAYFAGQALGARVRRWRHGRGAE